MLVVDASVIAPVVADRGPDGAAFRHRLHGETIAGPDLLRVEVMSAIRRQAATAAPTTTQAPCIDQAIHARTGHEPAVEGALRRRAS